MVIPKAAMIYLPGQNSATSKYSSNEDASHDDAT